MIKVALGTISYITILLCSLAEAAYVDNGNGTISDTNIELMWQKTDDGASRFPILSEGDPLNPTTYCQNLSLAGFEDWRLPTHEELNQLVNTSNSPMIHSPFDCQSYYYWTSTVNAQGDYFMKIDFGTGLSKWGYETHGAYVRCVRDTPPKTCEFSDIPLWPEYRSHDATGDVLYSFQVQFTTTTDNCESTATENSDWIGIASGYESGTGAGYVYYMVKENNSTVDRSAAITVAGHKFIINQFGKGKDTVSHNELTWQRVDDGIARTWSQAKTYCNNLSLGRSTDWRLPTINELEQIMVCSNGKPTPNPYGEYCGSGEWGTYIIPTIDQKFGCRGISYWSSTKVSDAPGKAWNGNFSGAVRSKQYFDSSLLVRCVRGDIKARPKSQLAPVYKLLLEGPKTEIYVAGDTGDVYSFSGYTVHKNTRITVGDPITSGIYRGHITFVMNPPFYKKHPGAKIKSIKLELYISDGTYIGSGASYAITDLSSLIDTDPLNLENVNYIDTNNTPIGIWNAIDSGPELKRFSSVDLGKNVLELNSSNVNLSTGSVMYYLGLREIGDNDDEIIIEGVSGMNPPKLIIEYK